MKLRDRHLRVRSRCEATGERMLRPIAGPARIGSLYELLGVSEAATSTDIRRRTPRVLHSRTVHPTSETDLRVAMRTAANVLSDPRRREAYDRMREMWLERSGQDWHFTLGVLFGRLSKDPHEARFWTTVWSILDEAVDTDTDVSSDTSTDISSDTSSDTSSDISSDVEADQSATLD